MTSHTAPTTTRGPSTRTANPSTQTRGRRLSARAGSLRHPVTGRASSDLFTRDPRGLVTP
jgi:hypothetical protein